jgi:uncharacterized membrane protein (DUF4010 family)
VIRPPSDDLLGFTVALAVGLIIGIERERRKGRGPGREPAGIRTFALAGLLGAVVAFLGSTAALVVGAALVALLMISAYVKSSSADPGITTEVALITTFFLGVLAMSEPQFAAGLGVVVAILLTARDRLHRFVRDIMTEDELHDLLLFAASAAIVLPLLTDDDIGPWDSINPYEIWRLVVLVMGVSSIGYVALRGLGPKFGLPISGLAGGFISSAATITSMGSTSRSRPATLRAAVAGAVLSTVATIVQMALVLMSSSRSTLRELAPALVLGGVAAGGFGVLTMARLQTVESQETQPPGRAFRLSSALTFAALITVITVAAAGAEAEFGRAGVALSAALAGFADTHAAAASVGALVRDGKLDPWEAVIPILLAMTTNTLTKASAAVAAGGRNFALPVWVGLALVLGGLWVGGAFSLA